MSRRFKIAWQRAYSFLYVMRYASQQLCSDAQNYIFKRKLGSMYQVQLFLLLVMN